MFSKKKGPAGICRRGLQKMLLKRSACAAKLGLELFDAAGGINESFFTGVNGVRIHRDIANDYIVLNAIDDLFFVRAHDGASQKILTGRNISETDRVELGMNFSFHWAKNLWRITLGGL
jgi:hypothetical protein